ncbi:hypothetical protein TVAG_103840 [Trichomonas vaginalis G3]|uniref:Uncharacterized protein n=1 Tax=Trichomonas vaginalis (strain ATCC PRA-98 / G3) TaxID=412133 RepID=A2FJW3_TRIV3|nr:hypothetical protein TVAG_103840 [Trichomonas vaginalis G3]|eukprot:XP_001307745.1 hypothetical protein [Trichomonas vaginalis G3]
MFIIKYYESVALMKDGTATSCVKFASKILEKFHDKLSIAIIGGIGTIVGVVENDTIEAVCSDASKRANQIVRDAPKGRCYIDYDIANNVEGNLDEYFHESVPVLVSPLTRQ